MEQFFFPTGKSFHPFKEILIFHVIVNIYGTIEKEKINLY